MKKRKKVIMHGFGEKLTDKRSIWMGLNDEEAGSDVYLAFTNGRRKTVLRISWEAAEAMVRSWGKWQKYLETKKTLTYECRLLINFLGPSVPFAYAGIPAVENPGEWWSGRFQSKWTWKPLNEAAKAAEIAKSEGFSDTE